MRNRAGILVTGYESKSTANWLEVVPFEFGYCLEFRIWDFEFKGIDA